MVIIASLADCPPPKGGNIAIKEGIISVKGGIISIQAKNVGKVMVMVIEPVEGF